MEKRAIAIVGRLMPAAAAAILISTSSQATPRIAASYGQNCHLCHVNPTGGGMRTSFVTQFMAPTELAIKPLTSHEPSFLPNPKINDQITIGADSRMLYVANTTENAAVGEAGGFLGHNHGGGNNSFFEMQGTVYLSFEPDPLFDIYFAKGWYNGFETFALGRVLPAHGYIKIGQFVPDMGWRWDDHTRFTREALFPFFPLVTDAGVEAGIYPGPFAASVGVFNGSVNSLDDNSQKELVGRVLYRQRIGHVNAALGGSARWNRGADARRLDWGAQAEAGWGKLAYLGDFFRTRNELLGIDTSGTTRSWVFSQQLDFKPHQGIDLYVGYDYYDPNTHTKGPTQTEITVGTRIYVRHFLSLEPSFHWGKTGGDTSRHFELVVHAFY